MCRQNQELASRPVIVFRGGTSALAVIYGHAYKDVRLHGCRAFGEPSRTVVEPRLERAAEEVR